MTTVLIKYRNMSLLVEGTHHEKEKAIHYPIDKAYAGMPERFEIKSIEIRSGLIENIDETELEQLILKEYF